MQPLGYYGLQVSERVQAEIDSLDLTDLIQLQIKSVALIATSPSLRIFTSEEFSIELDNAVEILSDIRIIGFTRYLCDRIEAKLIQQIQGVTFEVIMPSGEPGRCPCGDELLSTCQGCNGWTMEQAK